MGDSTDSLAIDLDGLDLASGRLDTLALISYLDDLLNKLEQLLKKLEGIMAAKPPRPTGLKEEVALPFPLCYSSDEENAPPFAHPASTP